MKITLSFEPTEAAQAAEILSRIQAPGIAAAEEPEKFIHPVSSKHPNNFRRIGLEPGQEIWFIDDHEIRAVIADTRNAREVFYKEEKESRSLNSVNDAVCEQKNMKGGRNCYDYWAVIGNSLPLSKMKLVSNYPKE